jgi:hypothetical protein
MATLVGIIVGRQPVIRRIVKPDDDSALDDPRLVKPEETLIKLPLETYDKLSALGLDGLDAWLKQRTDDEFHALDDKLVTDAAVIAAVDAKAIEDAQLAFQAASDAEALLETKP